jgi:glutamine amidotransferase
MSLVAIVDYGMCNLDSIRRAVEECGGTPVVTDQGAELSRAERIILPGVGAFADAMRNLRARGLHEALDEQVRGRGKPVLGVCLGMQLMAARGTEGGATEGLGWFDADVERLVSTSSEERLPHVGWNEVVPRRPDHPLFRGIAPGKDFYFVHSYHVRCTSSDDALASTPYCSGFTSVIARGQVMGVQFHPEKSQRVGFALLRNFLAMRC